MSWDVMLVKTNTNTEPMESIGDKDMILFDKQKVIAILRGRFPSLSIDSDDWIDFEGDAYSISFDLSESKIIMLHVHIFDEPEDAALSVISELCKGLNCRAFDTTSAEFLPQHHAE